MVISGNIAQFLNYNVSASGIGATTANITWMTNGISNSIVDYGLDTSYGSTGTNTTSTVSHLVNLNSLTQHTTYHYKITSMMSDGATTISADKTFTTTYTTGSTVATKAADTTIVGIDVNITSGGNPQVNISTAGLTTAHDATSVTVTAPATSGWDTIKYVGAVDTGTAGILTVANINSVVMSTKKVETDLGGTIGTAGAKIDVPLTKPVSGVAIEQKIIQGATTDATNAFQLAATSSSLDIKSVAYTVKFENTAVLNDNLDKTKGITLDFSVAHAWVEENGGTANIKIFRFGDDGTKEVLSTTYTGSSGSTDNFQAISYNGLSTFGMTAVASTVSGGGGSGGGSGGSGSTGGGGGFEATSEGPAIAGRVGPVQQALAPVVQQISRLLAPFQEPAVSTYHVSITGLTVTTKPSGLQTIQLAKGLAGKSGAGVSLAGNVITVRQPDFTLLLTTSDIPVNENGMISGAVSGVDLATAPATAPLSIGTVSFSLDTPLASVPENGMITTTITETMDPAMVSAYQSAAIDYGRQVEDVACSVIVEKSALATTGPAMITMSVPQNWVLTHGGTGSIAIAHLADDGTAELLGTSYSGLDSSGNIIFTALSPRGLSSFSIVSLRSQPPGTTQGPSEQTTVTHAAQQEQGGVVQNIAGVSGRFVYDNLVIITLIIILMLAAGAVIIIDDRRSGGKKKSQKK